MIVHEKILPLFVSYEQLINHVTEIYLYNTVLVALYSFIIGNVLKIIIN